MAISPRRSWHRHLAPLVDAAAPGEVAVSPAVWAALGGRATGRPIGGGGDASTSVGMLVDGLTGEGLEGGGWRGTGCALPTRSPAGSGTWPLPPRPPLPGAPSVSGGSPVAVAAPVDTLPAVRAFLPRVVVEHHDAGHHRWLAENRHVTTLFIKLPTPCSASFGLAQSLVLCIQEAASRWHGMVR